MNTRETLVEKRQHSVYKFYEKLKCINFTVTVNRFANSNDATKVLSDFFNTRKTIN